ncbi:MAG: DMT family transporter, partial [Sphingobacteriales bacterium]
FLAFAAGAFLPIQAGINARMGKAAQSAVFASLTSFVVGTIGLLLYMLLTKQQISISGIKSAPTYAWFGGLLGAFYVTVIVLAFPKLGPGVTFGLVVAGQMIFSLLLEHNQILVEARNPITLIKVFGVILIIAGVVILRRF